MFLSTSSLHSLFRMVSVVKLANKVKRLGNIKPQRRQRLLCDLHDNPSTKTPAGFLPVYVGERRQRFIIPVHFLSHPLFRMLLERAHSEYGFQERGLMFPCSTRSFQEVVIAAECSCGQFELKSLIEEL